MRALRAIGDKAEQAYRRSDALAKRRKLMEAWADFRAGKKDEAHKPAGAAHGELVAIG
jgi:hypothetical protein